MYLISYATEFLGQNTLDPFQVSATASWTNEDNKSGVDRSMNLELWWESANRSFGSGPLPRSALLSVSIARPSFFGVQLLGTTGIVEIQSNSIWPTEAYISQYANAEKVGRGKYQGTLEPRPCCQQTLIRRDETRTNPPRTDWNARFYPGTSGFIYIIQAVEKCVSSMDACPRGELQGLSHAEQV